MFTSDILRISCYKWNLKCFRSLMLYTFYTVCLCSKWPSPLSLFFTDLRGGLQWRLHCLKVCHGRVLWEYGCATDEVQCPVDCRVSFVHLKQLCSLYKNLHTVSCMCSLHRLSMIEPGPVHTEFETKMMENVAKMEYPGADPDTVRYFKDVYLPSSTDIFEAMGQMPEDIAKVSKKQNKLKKTELCWAFWVSIMLWSMFSADINSGYRSMNLFIVLFSQYFCSPVH